MRSGSAPAPASAPKRSLRETADVVDAPMLGQRFPLHHQIDRPARLALHDRIGALQRLLDDHAGRQRPLPFDVGPHQAALIERLLHEMHVGVAGADQLVVRGVGRLAGHEQHRQPAAVEVVHGVGRIGGADIDMHQHALAAAGDQRVAAGHMGGGVLVRTADDFRQRLAALAAVRHLFDDRRMIGAEIAEQILDADLVQALEQVIRAGEIADIGVPPYRRVHGFPPIVFWLIRPHYSIAPRRRLWFAASQANSGIRPHAPATLKACQLNV